MSLSDRSLLEAALALKEVRRAGWVRAGVEQAESVADHSWGVALLALVLCPEELDLKRLLTLALLHDLAETHTGDITPHDGLSREEKTRRERVAAASLFADHPVLWGLWEDYEQQRTAEARFVHQLDKLEMGLQASRYARERGLDPAEFIRSARARLTSPALLALLED